jgi:curved DNA-binding protein CbpA
VNVVVLGNAVKIPLDYYRILGLPVQATPEQVRQSHFDRTLQRPKWEYSEVSLEARRSLLDEAYEVLSSPSQRQAYDAQFLPQALDYQSATTDPSEADTFDLDAPEGFEAGSEQTPQEIETVAPTPTLEIADDQFVGALIIYLELGEYELVLHLGELYGSAQGLKQLEWNQTHTTKTDIVLTIAIASLELGREQWRQGHYETAAESLNTGLDFLGHYQTLPHFVQTIEAELYKLRPYRILELLALPDEQQAARQKGLQLLRDMLQDRQGIDGSGDDRSGLQTDDFLRFIQQLRAYLTALEQIEILEAPTQRPSAVTSYLKAYALIAQGFTAHQPVLIRQANQLLNGLAHRQDVHLEQVVCCLLLGQTQRAFQILDASQDKPALQFIQNHSPDTSDLLPGLCRYVEHWLQQEVLPYCRGLGKQDVRLNPYFEDSDVQAYLEDFLDHVDSHSLTDDMASAVFATSRPIHTKPVAPPSEQEPVYVAPPYKTVEPRMTEQDVEGYSSAQTAVLRAKSAVLANKVSEAGNGFHPMPNEPNGSSANRPVPPPPPPRQSRTQKTEAAPLQPKARRKPVKLPLFLGSLGVLLLCGLGVGLAYWILSSLLRPAPPPTAELAGAQLEIGLDESLIDGLFAVSPNPTASPTVAAQTPLTKEKAAQSIQDWLGAKSAAMGKDHNIQGLEAVLTGTMLTKWQQSAQQAKQDGWYVQYDHQLTADSIKVETTDPKRSQVYANVRETAQDFIVGSDKPQNQSEDSLLVRYELVLQNGKWRIQSSEVLKQG